MRVFHLLEATLGGTRRHVIDLLLGLQKNYPSKVKLYFGFSTIRSDENFSFELKKIKELNIECIQFDMYRSIRPFDDIKILFKIISFVREHNINIIHAHSAKAGYIGRLAAYFSPGVLSVYTPNASPYRLSKIYHLLEMIAGHFLSDKIIAVSESERQELISNKIAKSNKIITINSGIPNFIFHNYLNNKNEIIVGSVGRLTSQKAPLRFIKIAEHVVKRNNKIKFIWIGDGELKNEMLNYINQSGLEENILLKGWSTNIEKDLLDFDIFLLASNYESFGYVTLEAMRAGLPCIVSNIAGSRDLVAHNKSGFIIDLDNIEQYSENIIVLANNFELRTMLGNEGKKRWKKIFHADLMVKKTFNLYCRLLNNEH